MEGTPICLVKKPIPQGVELWIHWNRRAIRYEIKKKSLDNLFLKKVIVLMCVIVVMFIVEAGAVFPRFLPGVGMHGSEAVNVVY